MLTGRKGQKPPGCACLPDTFPAKIFPSCHPTGSFQPLIPLAANLSYTAAFAGPHASRTASGYIYLVKSAEAFNGQVLYAPEADPSSASILIPNADFLAIIDVEVLGNYLVLTTSVDYLYQTHVLKLPDTDDVSSVVSSHKGPCRVDGFVSRR